MLASHGTMPRTTPHPDPEPLIAALPESLQALARRGALQSFRRGELIIREGSEGSTLYVLLAGRVKVFSDDLRGREIVYGVYGAGEYLGEMSLDGGPRAASVQAIDPTVCAVITRPTLLAYISERPAFALDLLAKVIRRARAATLSARQLALNDAYGRLAALLNAQALASGDGTRVFDGRPTHRELASRLGCSRAMVTRLLGDLEAGGYVAVSDDGMRLLRPLPARW